MCSYFILKLKRTHTLSVLAPVDARPVEYSGELYICLYVIFDLKKYIWMYTYRERERNEVTRGNLF